MTEPRGLVVVGASAGGVEALRTLVSGLSAGFDGAVCIVLHIPRSGTSALPGILSRSGPLPAAHATDGCQLEAGRVYVAPTNLHLLVAQRRLRLSHGPAENGHRPAIDPMFRSAARGWGAAVVGVVLSGTRDDGAYGLSIVARHGGSGLVQDPEEALYPSMPQRALDVMPQARVMPVGKMGGVLGELLRDMSGPAPRPVAGDAQVEAEDAIAELEDLTAEDAGGRPAGFGCPSCHGSLFELPGSRFRCRVGHAWTAAGLLEEQGAVLEGALWMALRSLEEKSSLSRRMAESASLRGSASTAERYQEAAGDAEGSGRVIRRLIDQLGRLEDKAPGGNAASVPAAS
jgi:two-component system chemotaxis response regulator CheB